MCQQKSPCSADSWMLKLPALFKLAIHGNHILLIYTLHPFNEYAVCLSRKHNEAIFIFYMGMLLAVCV